MAPESGARWARFLKIFLRPCLPIQDTSTKSAIKHGGSQGVHGRPRHSGNITAKSLRWKRSKTSGETSKRKTQAQSGARGQLETNGQGNVLWQWFSQSRTWLRCPALTHCRRLQPNRNIPNMCGIARTSDMS
ncbi:hypothetical protein Bealeia1_02012 (plasmid) [Candidatus Bealeia paramacronuclearis]|uniref:Uncharacterized protein n=1 Tax=Candidatus Bealeia paramacronuclearis TaxID=1921001 RepID=A0ABZ2C655_9PROT